MNQLVGLGFGGGNHLRIAVAGVDHGDAGKTVDILAAPDIGYDRAFRLFNHNGRNRPDKTRYDVIFILLVGIRNKFLLKQAPLNVARWNVSMFYVKKPF